MRSRSIVSDVENPDPSTERSAPSGRYRGGARPEPSLRPPRAEDARGVWQLVCETPSLDANSPYAYLLLCSDFSSTSAVAVAGDRIVGFVVGYRPPARPEAWFVWQVTVHDDFQGQGLARRLLDSVLHRLRSRGVTHLEATVTPSNVASWALFRGLARRAGVEPDESTAFPSRLFPDAGHEDEVRIRIGPLEPRSAGPARR